MGFQLVGYDHIDQVQIIDDKGIACEKGRRIEHVDGAGFPAQLQRKGNLWLRDFKVEQQDIARAQVSQRLTDMIFADSFGWRRARR